MHYISILYSIFWIDMSVFFQEELKLHHNGEMHCRGVHSTGLRLYMVEERPLRLLLQFRVILAINDGLTIKIIYFSFLLYQFPVKKLFY